MTGELEVGRVAVIGGGTMGSVIALEFALAGLPVALHDADERLEGARTRAAAAASALQEHGFTTGEAARVALERLEVTASLEDAVAGAGYVVEAITEDLEAKRALFSRLDALCPPPVVLASNTSSLSAAALATAVGHAERVLITHYFNPPYLLPLVEVVRHEGTDDRSVAVARALLVRAGKMPAVIHRDVPGMVGNRLQAALLREACALVEAGVIDRDDLDRVVTAGFGRRLGVLGPFAVADLAGLDVYDAFMGNVLPDLNTDIVPPRLLRECVEGGHLGAKTGRGFYAWPPEKVAETIARRDRVLFALRRDDNV